jgi:hypothetical protein
VQERLKDIFAIEDPIQRMTCYLAVLKSLKSSEDMQNAFTSLMENQDWRGRGQEMRMLLGMWSKTDPTAALAQLHSVEDGRVKQYGASQVLAEWAKTNPDAAKAWALEHGTPKSTENAEGEENDPSNWYMVGVIAGLAKTNLDLATAWAQEQPRSEARGEMMDSVLGQMQRQRGLEATQQWVDSLPAGVFRDGVTRRLVDDIAEKDPTKAATWVDAMPQSPGKAMAMQELVEEWAERDANAAGTWLGRYPASKEMDDPRRTFAWEIRRQDPESSMIWAGTITDPRSRERTQVELMRDWYRRDNKSAATFMLNNNWKEESVNRVIR